MLQQAILCVDDERIILNSLVDQLMHIVSDEYVIEVAESGEEALEILENLLFEGIEVPLIISDQIMPGMKGDELLKTIHQRYPQALKIFLTGQADADAVGKAVNTANLYRYISKPWDETDLALTIKEALYRYSHDKRLAEQQRLRDLALEQERLAKEALSKANEELELRVRERTAELAVANLQLQKDIEEEKHLEQELRAAKEAAEAANLAKSTFLATMSHELRTPLNAILGFTQLLLYKQYSSSGQQEFLKIISRSAEHLLMLINQVLDLSKIEANRMTLNEQNFNLMFLLIGVIDLFRLRAREKGLQLNFSYTPDVPHFIRSDEAKLRQVLLNLLSNAIKFTREGSVTLRVTSGKQCPEPVDGLKMKNEESESTFHSSLFILHFEVEDTGIGIGESELERIFEAFTQIASNPLNQEGTGLGLTISQKFVRLMGGNIRVSSKRGHGSVFAFDIYVSSVDEKSSGIERRSRKIVAVAPDQPRYRILVVDDAWDNRQLLIALLQQFDFELQAVDNGQEALAVWEQWRPHLILLDIHLPDMSSYEIVRTIRAFEAQIPDSAFRTVIICITSGDLEREQGYDPEAVYDDFLQKPFQAATFFESIAEHLGVQFIYEDEEPSNLSINNAKQDILTPEILATLPDEMRAELKQAIEAVNLHKATLLVEQLQMQNSPLADALGELVKNYRFDTLQALMEKLE